MSTRLRLPIYARVLLCFLVNLLLLASLGYGFMRLQFRLGLDWMLAGPAGERIEQIASGLTSELSGQPENVWPAVLRRQQEAEGLTIILFSSNGRQILGDTVDLPDAVKSRLIDKRSPNDRPPPPPRDREGAGGEAPPKPRFILRSDDPTRYWAGIHLDLVYREGSLSRPLTLVMMSESLTGGGLFLDPWPWLGLVAGGLVLSVLMWWPLVRGMTRAIRRLNAAARRIADGRFEERVPEQRGDELGELAVSVNAMAGQLGDYVAQQRRITADVAHELCSPIARMQMALGVIEQRGMPEQAAYLKKVDTELQHMARLVEEVLAFSKAETLPERAEPELVNLRDLVEAVVAREAVGSEVRLEIPESLHLRTLREALERALSNIVRNASRYAGTAGPINIGAHAENGRVSILIADQGPGVPPEALARLFEPFYRPEAARGRHSGGSGLGLAIVKRCIEACGGTVTARLRNPTGLEVAIELKKSI